MALGKVLIYAKNMDETALFYQTHFGFKAVQLANDRIIELVARDGGANIMLHPAAKGQKQGQTGVKLIFDIKDVEGFCAQSAKNGLDFGPIHRADGYVFANAKDPCQNAISVSSRAFRKNNDTA
ncbi:VOC family protein [Thalassospira sp.]|uniref:VOC family protein n=1 Tax=Thalassospira sp. TaxID=1912094 RepID=UPI003AA82BC2